MKSVIKNMSMGVVCGAVTLGCDTYPEPYYEDKTFEDGTVSPIPTEIINETNLVQSGENKSDGNTTDNNQDLENFLPSEQESKNEISGPKSPENMDNFCVTPIKNIVANTVEGANCEINTRIMMIISAGSNEAQLFNGQIGTKDAFATTSLELSTDSNECGETFATAYISGKEGKIELNEVAQVYSLSPDNIQGQTNEKLISVYNDAKCIYENNCTPAYEYKNEGVKKEIILKTCEGRIYIFTNKK